MYLPRVKSATMRRRYRLGAYEGRLFSEIESIGPIQYRYVFLVFKAGDRSPCFCVASEYVLSVAEPILIVQTLVLLLWSAWTGGAFASQEERIRRAVFLAWGGILVLLALVMSFNLAQTWSRIPTDMAVVGQFGWTVNLAT